MSYLRLRVDGSAGVREIGNAIESIRGEESWDGVLMAPADLDYDVFVPVGPDIRTKETRRYDFIKQTEVVGELPATAASNPFDPVLAEPHDLKEFKPTSRHLEAYLEKLDPSRKSYTPKRQMELYGMHRRVVEACKDVMDPNGEVRHHIDRKLADLKKAAGADFN